MISGILSLSFGLYLNKQIKSLQLNYLFINLIMLILFFSLVLVYPFYGLKFQSSFDFIIDDFFVVTRIMIIVFLLLCLLTIKYYFLSINSKINKVFNLVCN